MEEFNDQQNQIEPEKSGEQIPLAETYSPYPLISPVAAAFLGLIGGFVLYQFLGGLMTLLIFGFDLEAAPVNGLNAPFSYSESDAVLSKRFGERLRAYREQNWKLIYASDGVMDQSELLMWLMILMRPKI